MVVSSQSSHIAELETRKKQTKIKIDFYEYRKHYRFAPYLLLALADWPERDNTGGVRP